MTISSSSYRPDQYTGSGTTGPFTITWDITDEEEVIVTKITNATGVTEILTLTTDYSVTVGTSNYVTLTASITSDYDLLLERTVPLTQELDLPPHGDFSSENIEDALDKLTKQNQDQAESIERAIKVSAEIWNTSTNIDFEFPSAPGSIPVVNTAGNGLTSINVSELGGLGNLGFVATIAELKTKDGTVYGYYIVLEDGKGGLCVWDSSDLSTEVTGDPNEGKYIPPTSDPTGASGAFVRNTIDSGGNITITTNGSGLYGKNDAGTAKRLIDIDSFNDINIGESLKEKESGPLVASGGISITGTIGSEGVGRTDAQLEILNPAGVGHCLVSLFNQKNPPDLLEEPGITFGGWNSTATAAQQQASISTLWALMDVVTVFRLQNRGQYFRFFGPEGATLFNTDANGDYQYPGSKIFEVHRQSGRPTIVGDQDMLIDANYGGTADNVWLNGINAGDVLLAKSSSKFSYVAGAAASTALAAMYIATETTTSRSINAGGTVNASGTDYAEYETKSEKCGEIKKGDIVGYDKDGLLTDNFSEAISFCIKSTSPSYVGGDVWMNGLTLPEKPRLDKGKYAKKLNIEEPNEDKFFERFKSERPERIKPDISNIKKPAELTGVLTTEALKEKQDYENKIKAILETEENRYNKAMSSFKTSVKKRLLDYGHKFNKMVEDAHKKDLEAYEKEYSVYEEKAEELRFKVDRIAYSGKVPVNIYSGNVGDYVIPVDDNGKIKGIAVKKENIDFEQFKIAVGQIRTVNKSIIVKVL
ncbi:MAG: hypothetical protein GY710_06370 [Desulfobacteraceae bacterium]|nr:hypothetical protein [Desulfobacteraceae bacterium]